MQGFDLMAIPSTIIDQRVTGAGMIVADVRLVDGSKQPRGTDDEYASLPLTLFSKGTDMVE